LALLCFGSLRLPCPSFCPSKPVCSFAPKSITLVPLPPYSPDLNPVERVWLYLRERYLSPRLLHDYEAVVDACCTAWNKLTAEAGRLRSLTANPYLEQVRA
jgi:DDE superfamily endonuclease